MKIRNLETPGGNPAPNQFIIETEKATVFKSYNSNIALKPFVAWETCPDCENTFRLSAIGKGETCPHCGEGLLIENPEANKTKLDTNYWDYSTTTGKYRNMFLGETRKETEKKIKSGEYVLTDLNA